MIRKINQKLNGLFDGGEDRGVSPVIGVILMVAITVILAAVIGAFVLGLGDNMGSTPQASINIDGDTVQVNSMGNADGVAITGSDGVVKSTITSTGGTATVADGDRVFAYIGDDPATGDDIDNDYGGDIALLTTAENTGSSESTTNTTA